MDYGRNATGYVDGVKVNMSSESRTFSALRIMEHEKWRKKSNLASWTLCETSAGANYSVFVSGFVHHPVEDRELLLKTTLH